MLDDAATIYQDAASRDPGNAIVWHMLGKSRANQDRFVEAEEAMGAAFARAEGPFRATILRDRAAIALRREDRASARELLRAALDVDPGNRAATELLATLGSAP
ncbi:MAG: tetratricopeptide repeat protein [Acidobacteriota bacterium]